MQDASFSMLNKTRGSVPRFPFARMKSAVLGEAYELSLAFISPSVARAVTREAKHIDKASNVLSFPLSKHSGEILICPATARAEASGWDMDADTFIAKLFIHGLLHLKGLPHGDTMDKQENQILKKFGFRN